MKLCFPASASARFAASLRSDAALGRTAAAQSVDDLQLCVYNMPAAGTVLRSADVRAEFYEIYDGDFLQKLLVRNCRCAR